MEKLIDREKTEREFKELQSKLKSQFGRQPGVDAILFLIGVNVLGQGNRKFDREEKMNLMHVAHCAIFSLDGYYELEKTDEDGWPHYKVLKQYPVMELSEQELFLKAHILEYFRQLDF
jgi:hypothetical protein